MHCFINLCRCCLSSNILPTKTSKYLCKKERADFNTTNYYNLILDIYPDLELKRSLPFHLCKHCQRLLREATKMKCYINYQLEDKQSQQLLINESMCSGCMKCCSSLFEEMNKSNIIDVCNNYNIEILKETFPHYLFQSHISYKYCESCSKYIKSVYLLKELLAVNNALYEKYCYTLTTSSEQVIFSLLFIVPETKPVDHNKSTETEILIKEEIDIVSDTVELPLDHKYDFDINNSGETRDEHKIDQFVERSHTEERLSKLNTCPKAFADGSNLKQHKFVHTGEKPYKCNICQTAFGQTSYLETHKKTCIRTEKNHYKLNMCMEEFSSSTSLNKDDLTHTNEMPILEVFVPSLCLKNETKEEVDDTLVTVDDFNSLETNMVVKEEIRINNESIDIENRYDIGENVYDDTQSEHNIDKSFEWFHTGETQSKMNTIPKAISSNQNLQKHKQMYFGKNPYKCNICEKVFPKSWNLKLHVRVHTGEKPFNCNLCSKSFSDGSNLRQHKLIHTGEKPYKCNLCPKAYSLGSNLKQHKLIHTGEKLHKCNICQKVFSTCHSLKVHERIHTGQKPHKCNICPKAFPTNSDLGRHKLIHTGEKPFKCNLCPKAFTCRSNLKQHKLIHTGEKPYKCNICPKAYTTSSNLKNHKFVHIGEKSNILNMCPEEFSSSSSLKIDELIHTEEKPILEVFVSSLCLKNEPKEEVDDTLVTDVDFNSIETNIIKEENCLDSESIEFENRYDFGKNLSGDT